MQNELLDLDYLIKVALNPSNLTAKKLDDNYLAETRQLAELELERIKQQFRDVAVVPGKQRCLEAYYRQHQSDLIDLANSVFCYIGALHTEEIRLVSNDEKLVKFYEAISELLENLLVYMQQTFPGHFDVSVSISKARRASERKGIIHCLKRIKKELKGSSICQELTGILCAPFENFLLPDRQITYNRLAYLNAFRSGIHNFHCASKIDTNDKVCSLLIFLNYNSLKFFRYFTMMHKDAARSYHTVPELILYYLLQLKEINQQPVKPGIAFNPALPPIKDQIANWLHDEIYYYEKQLQIQSNSTGATPTTHEKLSTSLSVAELACFMKLLQQAKVIRSDNSTELMNLIANNVRTDRSDTISPGSLRNKFYNVESSTVESIKVVIKDLLELMKG